MKRSILTKIEQISLKAEEVGQLLSEPSIISDQKKFLSYSKEYAYLSEVSEDFNEWKLIEQQLIEAKNLLEEESDDEMFELAEAEFKDLEEKQNKLEQKLLLHLAPRDPQDQLNVFLEIRAGTGGDEAAIFAGDLYRMYVKYAESQSWTVELLSQNEGDHGGFKEIVIRIEGSDVYGKLKFESGAHRVQRVPETESQGRIHTSACTVAIIPEINESSEVEINNKDLRIDTYRASGAGGQHVNKTDSAVRITHIPTGTVVECQDERSQHKNRAKAMSLLLSRISDAKQQEQNMKSAALRKSLVGSGDRSERIRSYNFPEGRITDHRIDLKIYRLSEILLGDLDSIIDPLHEYEIAEQLKELTKV
ncbi:MAG: peptide chain release factor 1 [Gammaproteobacteria bacterium]|jgi:peptide chain release factor 1